MNKFASSFSIANGLRISNKAELDHFIKRNEGRKGIIEIIINEQETTVLQWAYFTKVIIPALIKGFDDFGDRYTESRMMEYLQSQCPFCEGKLPKELSGPELSKVIDWCRVFAAEDLLITLPE